MKHDFVGTTSPGAGTTALPPGLVKLEHKVVVRPPGGQTQTVCAFAKPFIVELLPRFFEVSKFFAAVVISPHTLLHNSVLRPMQQWLTCDFNLFVCVKETFPHVVQCFQSRIGKLGLKLGPSPQFATTLEALHCSLNGF